MKLLPLNVLAGLALLLASALPVFADPVDATKFTRPIKVACIGDSITAGAGAEKGMAYPSQLQEMLGGKWEVRNFGLGGRTLMRKGDSPYWKEKAFQEAQAFQPDVVVLMLGTNDSKPQNWAHSAEFYQDYTDFVDTFEALPSKPAMYVCRPVFVPEPGNFGINEANVELEIPMIEKIAAEKHASAIDMNAPFKARPDLLPDRVHPDTVGAAVMAELVFKALTRGMPAPRPNALFADNAVLQRGVELPVWGLASDGEKVTVEFAGQKVSGTAAGNKWSVRLKPLKVSAEPQTMTIQGSAATRTLSNMLVGDVWLCSGQSNMERRLGPWTGQQPIENWQAEAAAANHPQIRQYYVNQATANSPLENAPGSWSVCMPESVLNFTAIGYFFARDLHQAVGVPVGIIHSSWGGTSAEAWTGAEGLKNLPDFELYGKMSPNSAAQESHKGYPQELIAWFEKNDPGSTKDQGWQSADLSTTDWKEHEVPAKFTGDWFGNFDGVVWFRKEVELGPEWSQVPAVLRLGAIDDADTTWVNGVQVGGTEGGNVVRNYRIEPGILKPGRNVIAVRLLDKRGEGGWMGSADALRLEPVGESQVQPVSLSLSGTWAYKQGADLAKASALPPGLPREQGVPTVLYNAMIAPLTQFPIKGVCWYQGENNSGRGKQYRALLPALIADWRRAWNAGVGKAGQKVFPFLVVQIAPYKAMNPDVREAQLLTVKNTPNTALIVTTDVGDANDIHPPRKAPVGARLALAARAVAYGEKIEYSGPVFESVKFEGNKAKLSFSHVGTGLVAKDGALKGFVIASADKTFVPAHAEIKGNTVEVWSDQVPLPAAVRYGWASVPDVNLFNKEGLPASPFRTDVE